MCSLVALEGPAADPQRAPRRQPSNTAAGKRAQRPREAVALQAAADQGHGVQRACRHCPVPAALRCGHGP